jgi:hypothetical protein
MPTNARKPALCLLIIAGICTGVAMPITGASTASKHNYCEIVAEESLNPPTEAATTTYLSSGSPTSDGGITRSTTDDGCPNRH